MGESLGLPHWTVGDALPSTGDPKLDTQLKQRLQAIQENFEGLVAQTAKQLAGAFEQRVPPGVINQYGGTTAPTGYLLCNGSAVSRSSYADLFAVVGTAFGAGDGSTTFNLPDLNAANRFPRGSTTVGGTGGTTTHTHTTNGPTSSNNLGSGGGVGAPNYADDVHTHTMDSPSHLPPYLNLVYVIKT